MNVNQAFNFTSTIKSSQLQITAKQETCIYCSSPHSTPLLQDGSFRQCNQCRKHFRPSIQSITSLSQPVSYQQPIFQSMRPIYQPTKQ